MHHEVRARAPDGNGLRAAGLGPRFASGKLRRQVEGRRKPCTTTPANKRPSGSSDSLLAPPRGTLR